MPIILLQDMLDLKQREQDELDFYTVELKKLMDKMQMVRREIQLTEQIIDMIERESVIDSREAQADRPIVL